MKRLALLLAAAPLTFSAAVLAKDVPAPAAAASLMPAGSIKWVDVQGFPGVKMAALEGDPEKGAHHSLLKLPAGFSTPLHHHSADHYVTVVSGNLVLNVDGKDVKLPAGSWFSFKGKKQHLTKCEAGADCVLSNDSRDKWDVVAEEKKDAAKKDAAKADAPKKDAAKK